MRRDDGAGSLLNRRHHRISAKHGGGLRTANTPLTRS